MRGATRGHNLQSPWARPESAHRICCQLLSPSRCFDVLMNTSFPEKVLQLVASVAETDEVRTNLELPSL